MIECVDCVLVNFELFCGSELDSGIVFEVGYVLVLGKLVYVYFSDVGVYIECFVWLVLEWFGEYFGEDCDGW